MGNNLKGYGCLVLSLISAFNLGLYSMTVMHNLGTVEPHRWVMTSLFGLMFLGMGVNHLQKKD